MCGSISYNFIAGITLYNYADIQLFTILLMNICFLFGAVIINANLKLLIFWQKCELISVRYICRSGIAES